MIVPVYVPGPWFAVVTDGSIALLAPSTPADLVQEIWTSLRDGAGLTDQVQVLLRAGLAGLPPFALVSVEGGRVHAIVRGEVEIDVTTTDGPRVLSAAQVSTWTEEIVADARAVTVRTPSPAGTAAAGTADAALPVLSAVVRAGGVRVVLRDDASPASDDVGPARERRTSGRADRRSRRAEPVAAPQPTPVDQDRPDAEPSPAGDLDDLEHTVLQAARGSVTEDSVPAPVAPSPSTPPGPAEAPEDHDGLTVLSSDVVELRQQMPGWADGAVPGPLAVPTPRTPPPAKLMLSSGLVVSLNRPVLLGRAPQVSRVTNSELPRLVTVASPNQDISRTHAEVRMDGDDVLVTDLRSTNGVLLLRQGAGPQRLHPGEPTVVEPGVVVDLGEGATFTVERGV